MKFIRVFINRPVFTSMLFITILLVGVVSFFNLSYDLLPDITLPKLSVLTKYKNASPEIVENEITKKIEESLSGLYGVVSTRSVSTDGVSLVTLYFERGSDLKLSTLKLREKLDEISWQLPKKASHPVILNENPTSIPIMGIWVKGNDNFIRNVIARRLEQVEGVGEARIIGLRQTELVITLNPGLMKAYGVTLKDVIAILHDNNISIPLGLVEEGQYTFPIRFQSETTTPAAIGQLALMNGKFHFKDIAKIKYGQSRKESEILNNNKEGYLIRIYKSWDGNTYKISNNISKTLKTIKSQHSGFKYKISYSDATFIKSSFYNILLSLLLGSILAFLALVIFTGNIKIPFILGVSIPVSIIASFFFFYIFKFNVNIMSLSGLALAIGMLVDSSIVVLENIIKRKDVVKGASEVWIAVTTSILTTIAVFFPIIYIQGIVGMMLKPLSFAIIVTLLISLFVAFSLVPLLASKTGKIKDTGGMIYTYTSNRFNTTLSWAYKNYRTVFIISIIFLAISLLSFIILKKETIPNMKSDKVIKLELPYNSDLSEMVSISKRLSLYLQKRDKNVRILEEIGKTDPFGVSHTGYAKLRISGGNHINVQSLQPLFKEYNNVFYSVSSINPIFSYFEDFGTYKLLIPYTNFDDEWEKNKIVARLLPNYHSTSSEEIPIINLELNRMVAKEFNINTNRLLTHIKLLISGENVLNIKQGENRLEIILKIGDYSNFNKIMSGKFIGIPLKELFTIEYKKVPRRIIRYNGKRVIECVLPYKSNMKIPRLPFPYQIGGEVKEYKTALNSALFAFLISVFLVYMILASFYESFKLPLIIMITIPFAAGGSLITLLLTGTSINILSLIGIVIIVGIVVNNAIVLLDQAERLRKNNVKAPGMEAAKNRLRPILMTTLTTVLGLLPLSFGATLQSPLGRSVIGGLLFSTFATLIFIPIVYDKVVYK